MIEKQRISSSFVILWLETIFSNEETHFCGRRRRENSRRVIELQLFPGVL